MWLMIDCYGDGKRDSWCNSWMNDYWLLIIDYWLLWLNDMVIVNVVIVMIVNVMIVMIVNVTIVIEWMNEWMNDCYV